MQRQQSHLYETRAMASKGEIKKKWRQGRDTICNYQSNQAEPIFVPGPASGVSIKNVRGVRGKVSMREDLPPIAAATSGSQLAVTWNWP
jgi:hypothetical protein